MKLSRPERRARRAGRFTIRDILLVAQIAICGVLVTASMVAVRGLMRSVQSNYGFEPHDAMLASINLAMAGYKGDAVTTMQKRMIEAVKTIPGVEAVGMVNNYAPLVYAASSRTNMFKEDTTDLRPERRDQAVSLRSFSGILSGRRTALLAGRDFTWHDDKKAPLPSPLPTARSRARVFGSVENAVGGNFKLQDGTLVQIVGIAEDGKYMSLTEDQQPAVFLRALRSPANQSHSVVRSHRDPQQLATAMRNKLRELDRGLPVDTRRGAQMLDVALFPARVATGALGVLGVMGAICRSPVSSAWPRTQ